MSQQVCPVCKQKRMTWHMEDDTISSKTIWQCSMCRTQLLEDEKTGRWTDITGAPIEPPEWMK